MATDPKSTQRERLQRPGARIGIVVSRFHSELTGAMLAAAKAELAASGVAATDMLEVWVPGAFELPLVARSLAQRVDIDAVVCLGLILKGETEHDRWVAQGAVQGLVQASLEADKPILFGVLTCATLEQARARALPVARANRGEDPAAHRGEDKGTQVARAAIETLAALDPVEELS